ncbi:hypothetical protein EGI22_08245 [Lacihabitans sp. LS3-19]|uniref:glycosyl hydrolase family 18 protein n=1 Tax=Lacihabitans sp. LS3-19 TaxID=2487335 RepID=UPI0020CBD975|nr:glycosyl hydrolase family 18 protein [Lacihabitans sp. LS3-19]MCP9767900.1 hypothetical protein [Lacihabitans sp. LS3-19]
MNRHFRIKILSTVLLWLMGLLPVCGQYITSIPIGFNDANFSGCGTTQNCGQYSEAGGIKMYIDRIENNTAYFRIVNCATTTSNQINFGSLGVASGGFFIMRNSPCGIIQSQINVPLAGWYYEVAVPVDPSQNSRDYYGVYIPNYQGIFSAAGPRFATSVVSIAGTPTGLTLNAPTLTSPAQDDLTYLGGFYLQWNKNGNPAGTDYQVYVYDQTTQTVLKNYSSVNDVSQSTQSVGNSPGNYASWSVRAVKDGYTSAESTTRNFFFNNSNLNLNLNSISASSGSTSTNFIFNTSVRNIIKSPYPAPTVNIEFTRPDGSTFTESNITNTSELNFSHSQSFSQAGTYQYRFVANQLNRTAATTAMASFTVTGATVNNPLVTSPSAGANLTLGQMTSIAWSFPNYTSPISIELTAGTSSTAPVRVLYDPTTNDGTENWTVPTDLPAGQYRIKIYNTGAGENGNPTYVGYSGVFNIVNNTPVISISSPQTNANLNVGQEYPINWSFTNFSGRISIELTAGPSSTIPVKVLYDPTTNDGTENWMVPTDLASGQYRIKIFNTGAGEGSNPTYVGYSGVFNIVNNTPFTEKTIGYLPTYQWGANFNAGFLGIFTHINLSFINPTISGGVFQTDAQGDYIWSFSDAKSLADAKAKMSNWISKGFSGDFFLSIGGAEASGSLLSAYRTALNSSTNRTKLINGLNKFMANFDTSYKIKGIDMDLEYTAMNIGGYNAFVQSLADNLHLNSFKLSVAAEYKYPVGVYIQNDNGTTSQKVLGSMIDNLSLTKIDWLNMMSYDYTSANDLSGNSLGLSHSPYTLVQRDYIYWNTTRGLPSNKIVCGIPLFGHESGGTGGEIAYRDLKCKEVPAWYNPDLALRDNDQVSVRYCYYGAGYSQKPSVLTVYQNGRGTLQQKYDFVNTNNLGGKMFWAIGNDIWEDKNQALLGPLYKSACDQNVNISGVINSSANNPYQGQFIVSNATIQAGQNIQFNAENSIELNPPFQTQSQTVFKAQIKACDQASSTVSNSQILGNLKLENK